jgi:hypothetical protein
MMYSVFHIKEKLDPAWADWFEELQIYPGEDFTVLCGNLPDKSAVYGILSRLSMLGITLISVNCEEISSPNHHPDAKNQIPKKGVD